MRFQFPAITKPTLLILFLTAIWPPLLPAQTTHPAPHKLAISSAVKVVSIQGTGSKRFSSADIAAASGVKIGQTANDSDFKDVSRRLGECGAFTSVSYSYRYAGDGAHLELHVVDAEPFVPVIFENLVWFSDQELASKVREHVPLFRGMVPLTGTLVDQISDALQLLLIERKVSGHIDYLRAGPEDGPVSAIQYSVVGPAIHIGNVAFSGAAPEDVSLLENLARPLRYKDYVRTNLRIQADKDFLPVLSGHGYLRARFSDVQAKITRESAEEVEVDVTFPVVPGRQYKLAEIRWSGNKAFPTDKLQSLLHMKAGEPVNSSQLAKDLEEVNKLYGTIGYVACNVHPSQQIDESQFTVRYQLEVQEGEVYHMGALEIHGLDDRDSRKVVAGWKLAKGDIYDASYPARFLDEVFKTAVLDTSWQTEIHPAPDPVDKVVDVTLRFYRSASVQ